jgi:hypothetical protein
LESSVPKDQDAAEFIVTPAPAYDPNDKIVERPHRMELSPRLCSMPVIG